MGRPKYYDGSKWVDIAPSAAEFESHKNDGAAHGIGNKSLLKTTAKDSIVNSINELFTNANDGKTAVANAVTAKGVSASPSDTFAALATKIGQIATGKKWASGSSTSGSSTMSFAGEGGSSNYAAISVSGLDFTPSAVLIGGTSGSNVSSTVCHPVQIPGTTNADARIQVIGSVYAFRVNGNAQLSSDGFVLPFRYPNVFCNWIAFE